MTDAKDVYHAPHAAMTPDAAVAHVTSTNPLFALETVQIRGESYRAFKNIPLTIPAMMLASRKAQAEGAAEYLIYEEERYSYDVFLDCVNRMSQALSRELGVTQGDRVALAMRNYPELLILVLAVSAIGAVPVFLNAWWTTPELDYALRDSEARLVFADGPRIDSLKPLQGSLSLTLIGLRDGESAEEGVQSYRALYEGTKPAAWPTPEMTPEDDFAIMYSSGTTGHPKGVVLTHRGATNAVFSWLLQSLIAPLVEPPAPDAPEALRPAALVVTPLFHVTATHPLFLLSMPAGAKLVLMRKWDAEEAMRLIEREELTRFLGVPTQSAELMQAARAAGSSLPTLDYLGSGGAKRPPSQVAELSRAFPNAGIATGWGMTETNALGIGAIGADYTARPESAGKLHPPVQEMRLLDDAGREVAQGEIGELCVKSPANMRCYLNKPEATAEVLQEGWLRTGDLARVDEEGYVTILDRKKNIIIRGGENIACLDVEGALHKHPNVSEACAFSVPDDRLGECVGAIVQTRDGNTLPQAEMEAFLRPHLASFKIPQQLWSQAEPLLRGATDKIDRRGLRAQCLATILEGKE